MKTNTPGDAGATMGPFSNTSRPGVQIILPGIKRGKMKEKTILLLSISILFNIGCAIQNRKKIINRWMFTIEVPVNWKYKFALGIDSDVGRIVGKGVDLTYDYSEMGYANSLNPDEIEKYEIFIDTIGRYVRKIIHPKEGKRGMTGVYIWDLNSNFDFNISGKNLSRKNQIKAIESFKTIEIKRQ